MAGFDRSAFKGASSSKRKAQIEKNEEKTQVKKSSSSNGNKTNYLKLQKGKNYLRLFGIHPKTIEKLGFDESSDMYAKTVHFMEVMVKYTKDGEDVEELKRMALLNSKVHGGTKKDIIDEFISFAHKVAYADIQDEDERKKYLSPIKDWKTGITGKTKWVAYAKQYENKSKGNPELGRIELPVSVVNKMNELSAEEDDVEDVIETDIFTDPDTGMMVVITSDPEAGKKDPSKYYQVAPDFRGGADALQDSDLEWLMEQKPLNELFENVYTIKNFNQAIDGLKRFDETHKLGIFSYDEFLDIAEEIAGYYDEVPESEEEAKEEPKKEEEKSDMPFDKELEDMDMDELKGYIRRNKLSIRVLPRYTETDLVQFIREEEDIAANEKKAVEEPVKEKASRSSRLSSLADGLED
jgi:hypothetical protein